MSAVADTRFAPGNSGYRARLARRAAIKDALLADYNFSAPSHALLLPIIIEHIHSASRARSNTDRSRAANTARRMLNDIPRKNTEPPVPPSLDEMRRAAGIDT